MRSVSLLTVLTFLFGCSSDDVVIPDTCNGSVTLCERSFDAVAYATTHNAMSSAEHEWLLPNQNFGITRQLEDGVRGLMLDTHVHEDEAYLCHGDCLLGSQRLADGLGEIATFMSANRGEVITIIFESYVSPELAEAAFAEADLLDWLVVHDASAPWPTLREMIDTERRLVVFTDSDGGARPWYLPVWDHGWETHYAARETSDFSCEDNRGEPTAALFILNHFLTRTRPVPQDADETNANPLLIDRARQCQAESGKLPNFVTVDFYDVGDLFDAVDQLNGL